MARGGRLPRAAGRPPRFLRTGSSACYRPKRDTSPGCAQTLEREAEGVLESPFPSGIAGVPGAKGDIPRPGRGRPRRRRVARFRDGLLAAAEVADAAPAAALRPKGAVLREAAALPRLSETSRVTASCAAAALVLASSGRVASTAGVDVGEATRWPLARLRAKRNRRALVPRCPDHRGSESRLRLSGFALIAVTSRDGSLHAAGQYQQRRRARQEERARCETRSRVCGLLSRQ